MYPASPKLKHALVTKGLLGTWLTCTDLHWYRNWAPVTCACGLDWSPVSAHSTWISRETGMRQQEEQLADCRRQRHRHSVAIVFVFLKIFIYVYVSLCASAICTDVHGGERGCQIPCGWNYRQLCANSGCSQLLSHLSASLEQLLFLKHYVVIQKAHMA